ncbi:protein FAM133-like [Saccoglossus kowalevskii]|uniref:Protein FAM133-like n=1 Tax=Saccoglossus kowalevskii TaxID=10224 RepID=A0ABM0H1D9_SACKO|nr:PREDICTED: protein FAM133-like [Saccoglossus kowalevskii]
MGKRDTRVSYVNPIAMARARGPKPSAGPTIQDYLSRPRPTWDEVKGLIKDQQNSKGGSSALAEWEKQMNDKFKEDLKQNRERILGDSSTSKEKKKKSKKRKRERSPSLSSSTTRSSSFSRVPEEYSKKSKKRKKHRHHSSKDEDDNHGQRSSPEVWF